MSVAVGTQSSVALARIRWNAPPRDPLLHEVINQFAAIELALSLSRMVAEAAAREDHKPSSFSPIFDLEQILGTLTQMREWAIRNEQVAGLIGGMEPEAPLSDVSTRLSALKAERAEMRNASQRAVRRIAQGGSTHQWRWVSSLLEASAVAIREAELQVDEAAFKIHSLLRSPRRADLQAAEWSSCKELTESAGSASRLAREMTEQSWEYSQKALSRRDHDPVRRITYESPIELVIVITGAVGALVAVLDHLLAIRVKFKTRDAAEQAERARLEREISEDHAAKAAIERLQRQLNNRDKTELTIQEIVVSDEEFDEESR